MFKARTIAESIVIDGVIAASPFVVSGVVACLLGADSMLTVCLVLVFGIIALTVLGAMVAMLYESEKQQFVLVHKDAVGMKLSQLTPEEAARERCDEEFMADLRQNIPGFKRMPRRGELT